MGKKQLTLGPIHFFADRQISSFQKNILQWYDAEKRQLPWRKIASEENDVDKRIYAVWVSEIMLQQTQVATVMNSYNKWMKKWPTHQHLSEATLTEVNEVWAGLGYYFRAKRLHEGAQKVVSSMDGHFPRDRNSIMNELPGVGKYTASAISSIALNEKVGVVDGNVLRVCSRLRILGEDIAAPHVVEHIWGLMESLIPESRPGDFNQAVMELGARICTPKNPSCTICLIREDCLAFRKAQQENSKAQKKFSSSNIVKVQDIECIPDCELCIKDEHYVRGNGVMNFPQKKRKTKVQEKCSLVFIIVYEDQFLVLQRPVKGLLANLWEFPSILPEPRNNSTEENNIALTKIFADHFNVELQTKPEEIGEILHIFSHIKQTYRIHFIPVDKAFKVSLPKDYQSQGWWTLKEFESGATSTAMKKVLKCYNEYKEPSKVKANSRKRVSTNLSEAGDKKQRKISSYFTPQL